MIKENIDMYELLYTKMLTDYLNDVIARMPYMQKATNDELLQLLPHKWKKEWLYMAKAAYPTIGIAALVMFGIVYFIGCLQICDI